MPAVNAVGNDGLVVLPSGYDLNVRVWAATVAYVSTDTTGFSHQGKTRRLGVIDITGSVAGQPTVGNSGTPFGTVTANAIQNKQLGGTISLGTFGTFTNTNFTANTNSAGLQFDVVLSSFAFNADKNGDQTLSVNFEMNDSNGPTVVWATTLP
jgi:hypothetical protein